MSWLYYVIIPWAGLALIALYRSRYPRHAGVGTRFLHNRTAVIVGVAVACVELGIGLAAGAPVSAVLTALLVFGFVAAGYDRLRPTETTL